MLRPTRPTAIYLRAARVHQGHPGVVRRGYFSRSSIAAYNHSEQMVDKHGVASPNGVGKDRSRDGDNRGKSDVVMIHSES